MHKAKAKKHLIGLAAAAGAFLVIFLVAFQVKDAVAPGDALSESPVVEVFDREGSATGVMFEASSGGVAPPGKGESVGNAGIRVYVIAGERYLEAQVPDGSVAYDAMRVLSESGQFDFKSRYFASLGRFIDEIEGVKNSGGYYWTLYINGRYSNLGVSEVVIRNGDVIEWRYENK